jgi:hypothetical protein
MTYDFYKELELELFYKEENFDNEIFIHCTVGLDLSYYSGYAGNLECPPEPEYVEIQDITFFKGVISMDDGEYTSIDIKNVKQFDLFGVDFDSLVEKFIDPMELYKEECEC